MFGKKKTNSTNGTRNRTIIRETLERIVVRTRNATQIAFCTSCGKLTTCLTPEQAQEMFGRSRAGVNSPDVIENIHLLKAGETTLICAESLGQGADKETKKCTSDETYQ